LTSSDRERIVAPTFIGSMITPLRIGALKAAL
jgi:hypothetical protein